MHIKYLKIISFLMMLVFQPWSLPANNGATSPNIILILADDQGWTGTSVLMDPDNPESKSDFYETPNLERLASDGMRFSRAYSPAPKCSPSRMSILTGQTTARNQFTNTTSNITSNKTLVEPASNTTISNESITIAELLKTIGGANYTSAHFGKWHLGNGGPADHGFDESDGNTSNSDGDQTSTTNDDPKKINSITNAGIAFMEASLNANRPFYLQLSHYAVHTQVESTSASLAKYESKTAGTNHTNAEYAAMTEDLDVGVGLILDFLEDNNIADNTYVIYTSDNGGQTNVTSNAPLSYGKIFIFEGGVRVPLIISGPGITGNTHSDFPVIGYDFLPTIAEWTDIPDSNLPTTLDGVSIANVLANIGSSVNRTLPLIFHSPHYENNPSKRPRSAIMDNENKIIVEYESGERSLYDMQSDLDESEDLYSATNDLELLLKLRDYLMDVNAQMPLLDESNEDADADGLPDAWEFSYLLGTHYNENDDPDNDGVSNFIEYQSGSDPLAVSTAVTLSLSSDQFITSLYPNPVGDHLYINLFGLREQSYSFVMYNLLGNTVRLEVLDGKLSEINLQKLGSGVYGYIISDISGLTVKSGKILKM